MMAPLLILVFQAGLYALLAPGVFGLLYWLKARFQLRRGSDVLQPYRDLFKLVGKGTSLPKSASQVLLVAPPLVFACYLLLGFFLPSFFMVKPGEGETLWGGFDLVFVVYLLGLAHFVLGLATFDAASPLGSMSIGRQFFIHILAEPAFLIAIYALVLAWHSSNLSTLISAEQNSSAIQVLANPGMAFILVALGTIFLAESGRLPFDNPGTHLELTMIERGPLLEYSGRGLALLEWANAMKLTFFLSLLASLAFPWSIVTDPALSAVVPALLIYLVKLGVFIFLLAFWETAQVKMRLRQVSTPLVFAGLMLALIALIYLIVTNYLFQS